MALTVIATVAALAALAVAALALIVRRCYRAVDQGHALIIHTRSTVRVTFTGAIVVPFVQRAEVMDLRSQLLVIDRKGAGAGRCRDGGRVDLGLVFYVRVNRTPADVVRITERVGCARAAAPDALAEQFTARFDAALDSVLATRTFAEHAADRTRFKDELLHAIGPDLDGYTLDSVALTRFRATWPRGPRG